MYKGYIVEVFIASPSDVIEERKLAHNVLDEWNIINARTKKLILKSLRWEKDVYSSFGASAQSIINDQALNYADLLIGIFKSRLGTATESYESGTVEEIKRHINENKPAMIFFSKEKVDPHAFNPNEFQRLQTFKGWCQQNGVTIEYKDSNDFIDVLRNQIGLVINNNSYFSFQLDDSKLIDTEVILSSQEIDLINFLKQFIDFRNDNEKMSKYIDEIGDYRFNKIMPKLKELGILNASRSNSGFIIAALSGYYNYTKGDIENMIKDITAE